MFKPINDCSDQSSPGVLHPTTRDLIAPAHFDQIYIAPNVAVHTDELAAPPHVFNTADGALWLTTYTVAGVQAGAERVLHIDYVPPFALVHVQEDELSAAVGYLMHKSALPTAHDDREGASR